MTRLPVVTDSRGLPVLLADVPSAGVSNVDANARSGNPRHDVKSGKFGSGNANRPDAKELGRTVSGQPVAQSERLQRYYDAVRDAAREFDSFAEGDLKDFLAGRVQDVSQVDIAQFMVKVQEQRVTDVLDLLDALMRKSEGLIRNRRQLGLRAPKGFLKRAFNALSDDQVVNVLRRLESRNHDHDDVSRLVLPRITDENRREQLTSAFG